MPITKEYLTAHGWVEKSGVMVLFSNPRIGWKPAIEDKTRLFRKILQKMFGNIKNILTFVSG